MYLSLFVRARGRDTVAHISGEIDLYSGHWLQERLLRFLPGGGIPLVVDLSGVTFIDCSGLRTLLATCWHAGQRGCPVHFSALSPPVRRLAELAGLSARMPSPPQAAGRRPPRAGSQPTGRRGALTSPPRRDPPGPLQPSAPGPSLAVAVYCTLPLQAAQPGR